LPPHLPRPLAVLNTSFSLFLTCTSPSQALLTFLARACFSHTLPDAHRHARPETPTTPTTPARNLHIEHAIADTTSHSPGANMPSASSAAEIAWIAPEVRSESQPSSKLHDSTKHANTAYSLLVSLRLDPVAKAPPRGSSSCLPNGPRITFLPPRPPSWLSPPRMASSPQLVQMSSS
jgi:hypothetical protein